MIQSKIKDLRMTQKKLVIKGDYERVVIGEVYIPGQEDAHGNIMTAEEIKKACYNFMKNERTHNIDFMHNEEPTGSYLVENFLARRDDPDGFIEGAWVAATKIESDEIWNKILKGEINCYSLSGNTALSTQTEVVDRFAAASGYTHKNIDEMIPPHTHSYNIEFDEDNNVLPTKTELSLGHRHDISAYSVTEETFGHVHRYALEATDASYA